MKEMKDYLKFFGGLTVTGGILLLVGGFAVSNPEIRAFSGKGALLAGYAALGIGAVLAAGGSFGLAYVVKKVLGRETF